MGPSLVELAEDWLAAKGARRQSGPTRLSGDPLSEDAPTRLAKRRPGEVTPVLTSPKSARKGIEVAIRQLPSSPPCRLSPLQREEPDKPQNPQQAPTTPFREPSAAPTEQGYDRERAQKRRNRDEVTRGARSVPSL